MAPSMNVEYSRGEEFSKNFQKYSSTMMGKTQKFSKGYSSGFVSDYRHAVDNMAESEGLGSSGRMDTEMTASEGSSAPKRKCISLNVDSGESFGIPVQMYSVSKMSRSERKQLEMRLRGELDRVQKLQKKITMQFSNVVPVSSSSCGEVKKGTFTENRHRSMDFSPRQVNKKIPFGRSQSMKRGLTGRFESVSVKQEMPPSVTDPKLMEQCEAILKRLMSHEYGWVFNAPVDVIKLNIPDYFTVIKTPMDLGTVKSKLTSGQYSSPWGFLADVRLTFTNAMTYNPPTNDVHIMAKALSKIFEQRWKILQKKLPPIDSLPMNPKSNVSRESKAPKVNSPSKKRKISSMDIEVKGEPIRKEPVKKESVKKEPVKRIMTEEEKHNLNKDIESLEEELPTHIIDFLLKAQNAVEGQTAGGEEIMVDMDVFSDDTLFTLRRLVDEYLQEKQRNRAKTEPCEMELLNESGLSNSSLQPCKGNDPVEEDVDIGGNDLPVSSYPPVEIEKDTAHRSSKCSSSSSSSSDSSSSSSDSDSGSSSSSDTDGAKPSSPVNRTKENQTNKHGNSHDRNQSVSGLDQLERNPQTKPLSFEAESRHSEEDAPPERQVSPDKLYRAALLRNRFADTILKAQEKTLDQGEKGDPEKLRREREELERKQREEKARLQAEAKAAEYARRRAEEEAAAEAKRKRELDREAARQALQEMEKTVDINENCSFLEDLEMLGSASAPHLPLADNTSPDHSSDGIGGFKLQGSNPLEQLGLYMKVDDDEEDEDEDGEPTFVPKPTTDVEEGEID